MSSPPRPSILPTGTPRPILAWPDRRLATQADPVAEITDETHAIWADMIATMEAMPGVGLAAVQIGIPLRLAVVDASETRGQPICLANPEILKASATLRTHEEASPCLPGVHAAISRPDRVTVGFLDASGRQTSQEFVGLWATSVQHQIDHLAGRMYFDRLSRLKRDRLLKRARKVAP